MRCIVKNWNNSQRLTNKLISFHSASNSKKRRLHLLHSGDLADCEFIVGQDKDPSKDANDHSDNVDANCGDEEIVEKKIFRCHKMMLATASEIFERMFYGKFTEQPSPIAVNDISPDTFEVFIKYIYTYEMDPNYVTMQNLPELVYIGDKYMIQDFSDICIHFFQQKPCVLEDTLPIFELACLYQNEALFMISHERIREYGLNLLNDPSFFNLNINYVKRLMKYLTECGEIHANKLLIALEQYEKKNNANGGRNSEMFLKIVDAACCLDYESMDAIEYSSGPAHSHLFA